MATMETPSAWSSERRGAEELVEVRALDAVEVGARVEVLLAQAVRGQVAGDHP